MRQISAAWAMISSALLLMTACTDRGASPLIPFDARRLERMDSGLHLGESGFSCDLYQRPFVSGHEIRLLTRRVTLFFPQSELARGGATLTYSYRGYTGGPTLVAFADCVIPATEAAVSRTDRYFGMRSVRPLRSDQLSVASCPEVDADGSCVYPLDPVPAITCQNALLTYPDCGTPIDVDYEYCSFATGCGGGGWSSTWGTSGGGGGGSPSSDGSGPCMRDANGRCTERDLTAEEWAKLGARISAIKESTEACRGAKAALQALYDQGPGARRFRFWTGYNIEVDAVTGDTSQPIGQNLSDADGRYIVYDPRWVWEEPRDIVHEGLHLWLNLINSPLKGEANEKWVDEEEEHCI